MKAPLDEEKAGDEEDPETPAMSVVLGRGCAWCMVNHFDIPIFFLSALVLYLSVGRCCHCVLVVAIVSALLCIRFRILNATLWSAILVLYMHKNWDISLGAVRLTWKRSD
jgi:hypothetical protein